MSGERGQHQQHPFGPCHTLFDIHDHATHDPSRAQNARPFSNFKNHIPAQWE
jgi:hypothetical protein